MVEARSLPVKTACSPHPVRMSQRGIRTTAQRLCLEVYKDVSRPLEVHTPAARKSRRCRRAISWLSVLALISTRSQRSR